MKPESRSTREVPPERFEAHGEGNPHDLMSRRAQKYEEKLQTKVKKVKAMKKQIYRSEKKLVESVEEKEQSRKKETERKRLWRQRRKMKVCGSLQKTKRRIGRKKQKESRDTERRKWQKRRGGKLKAFILSNFVVLC